MYAIVELDQTISLVKDGKAVNFENEKQVREAIKELINALYELARLGRERKDHGITT